MSGRIVIVGGGQGGGTLAHMLRSYGHSGPVTLVCGESRLPYERPPLSKGMLAGHEATPVVPETFYGESDIDVRLATRASGLHRDGSAWRVDTDRGESLVADTVVLATGSTPRRPPIPGIGLDNVVTLNSIVDADEIRRRSAEPVRVVVIGGGFVGSEVSAGLRANGHDVTIVDPVEYPLAAKTAHWVAERLRGRLEMAGVRFVHDTVATIDGATTAESVTTAAGERLPCDVVLVAVGSAPNVALAEACGLEVSDGVVCDDRGRTSQDGVRAIGDMASWPYAGLGRLRVEHFRTAGDHAQAVASDLTGRDVPALRVPWFWTDQFDHRVEVSGRPALGETTVLRHDAHGNVYLSLHLRGDLVVGAVTLDAPREMRAASRLIEKRSPVDPTALADSTLDLRKAALIS